MLLEIQMAQSSQDLLQYNTSKLQWSNIFRNTWIFPKSTLKLSVNQHTRKLLISCYTEDTLPIGGPEIYNYTPITGVHIQIQWHYPVYLQSYSLQCFSSISILELSLGLEVHWLRVLLWLRSGKKIIALDV